MISTERVNCIQLSMQQRLLLVSKTFRHSIYVLLIVVLYCLINLVLNLGVLTSIDTRNWQQWYFRVKTVNETFDPCDVIARSGSHLVTSSFVRRLQCVIRSVIYSLIVPVISKVKDSFNTRLYNYLSVNNQLSLSQIGFRSGASTEHALLKIS